MDDLTIATWVLVAVTVGYVLLTGLLVRENRQLVQLQSRADVIAFVEVTRKHVAFLVIQNVGVGVAKRVRVGVPEEWVADVGLGSPSKAGFIKRGLSVLPGGARVHHMIARLRMVNWETIRPLPVDIQFQDGDRQRSSSFLIDLRELEAIRPGSLTSPGSIIGLD